MKEEQLIHIIKLLKTIVPSRITLKAIKQGAYQQVRIENKPETTFGLQGLLANIFALRKSYNFAFYGSAVSLLLILFLSVPAVFFPNQFHTAILYGRLAFASNQYQKAQIAFGDTKNRFTENKPIGQTELQLSESIALTNTELNNLKLKGENGKYTAQECHQIYQEYLVYLEDEEKNISKENNSSFANMKSQISLYEEQAEKKLHMYSSL